MDNRIQRVFVFVGSDTLPGSGLRDLTAMYDAPPTEDVLTELVRQKTLELPKRKWFSRAHRIDWVSEALSPARRFPIPILRSSSWSDMP